MTADATSGRQWNGSAWWRRAGGLVVVGVLCLTLTACWPLGDDSGRITVTAVFSDVADMADGAPVEMLDTKVGSVESIRLDPSGTRAELTLSIDASARVPARVNAKVRRTSPLGERYVDLRPLDPGAGGPLLADAAHLPDPATGARTEVVPDVEQLISSGTDLFTALSADQIAILLDESATAFGGKGQELGGILTNLADVTRGYATRNEALTQLVADIDELAADLAPHSEANATLFTNLAETTRILSENADRFFSLLESLNHLAAEGTDLLRTHFEEITHQVHTLQVLSTIVREHQGDVAKLLESIPRHNRTLTTAVSGGWLYALADIIVCNLPGLGDEAGNPAYGCYAGGQRP